MRAMSQEELRQLRGSKIAMVYQEPMALAQPSMKIAEQLAEVPLYHEGVSQREALDRAEDDAIASAARRPAADHEFIPASDLRRPAAARRRRDGACCRSPSCFCSTSRPRRSTSRSRAGIVELIKEISAKFGTSLIYISHNLGLILETLPPSHRHVFRRGPSKPATSTPSSTRCAIPPRAGSSTRSRCRAPIRMRVPSSPYAASLPLPHARPVGCYFAPRCDHAVAGRCDRPPCR